MSINLTNKNNDTIIKATKSTSKKRHLARLSTKRWALFYSVRDSDALIRRF